MPIELNKLILGVHYLVITLYKMMVVHGAQLKLTGEENILTENGEFAQIGALVRNLNQYFKQSLLSVFVKMTFFW